MTTLHSTIPAFLGAAVVAAFIGPARSSAQEPPALAIERTVTVRAPDDPARAYAALAPGKGRPASGITFTVGAGTYVLTSGTLWEVQAAGRLAGLWLDGAGTLSWKTDDAAATRVYTANAGRVGGFDAEGGALVARFSRAAFFFAPGSAPALNGAAELPAPAGDAFRKHLARFATDRMAGPEVMLAATARDGRRYFTGLLEAAKDVRHEVDETFGDEDVLAVPERPSGAGLAFPDWRFPAVIGRHPLGRSRRAVPRIDARLVDVAVSLEEGVEKSRGTFEVEETWVPQRPLTALLSQLRSEELTQRTYTVMPTRLQSVTDEAGRSLPFSFEKDTLVVHFAEPLPAGQPKKLRFRYDAPFFERAGGDSYWELPIGSGWYPQPLELQAAALHLFRATVRTRKPFLAFASGDTVRRAEEGEWNILETRLERPVPFANILAGKYTVQEETRDGVTCRVASYGLAKETSGGKLLNLFHRMRAFYEPYFGPFPWKEYNIVEINSYGFGQAPPNMMRITREAFQSNVLGDPQAEFFSGGINERFAHEIAHSYWGYVVWSAMRQDTWLVEAFAEFSAGLLVSELKGKSEGKRLANIWHTRGKDASSLAPVALAGEVSGRIPSGSDRLYLTYFKGATLLTRLRDEVGNDDVFFTTLKSFLRSFEKKPAVTTEQFLGLLGYLTKKDWKPWFETYYWGWEMPRAGR